MGTEIISLKSHLKKTIIPTVHKNWSLTSSNVTAGDRNTVKHASNEHPYNEFMLITK